MLLVLTLGLLEIPVYVFGLFEMTQLHESDGARELSRLLVVGAGCRPGRIADFIGRQPCSRDCSDHSITPRRVHPALQSAKRVTSRRTLRGLRAVLAIDPANRKTKDDCVSIGNRIEHINGKQDRKAATRQVGRCDLLVHRSQGPKWRHCKKAEQ